MSKQLKIAMISLHSCPLGNLGERDVGGMNVYVKELAHELGRKGHVVDIYTRFHRPYHKQLLNLGQNVRLIHLNDGGDEAASKRAIYSNFQKFTYNLESFRESSNLHYDLIHSHYWLSGLVGKQLQVWWHVPHVTMFHTLAAVKNSLGIDEDEPNLRITNELALVGNCDSIIAATERERSELIRHYDADSNKIAIIPCGVNLELFIPIDKWVARRNLKLDGENIILFVGRLETIKGLGQVLRALNCFENGEAPRLMIVGGDKNGLDQVKALRTLAQKLAIEDHVRFVGSVSQDRLPLFYSAADLCIIPSYHESFCMVALESLACGTPIVATDVGSVRKIIRSNDMGRIISDNSPHQLATAISAMLSLKKESCARQVEARRSAIAEFKWVNIADMMLFEYDSLLLNYPSQERLKSSHTIGSLRNAESPITHKV